jgi:hypothetical protein
MVRIPKWRLALPLTLRCKDWLELFFERRGHGQVFDDHVVQGGAGDRVQGHSRFLGFGDELRILQRFQESRFHGAHEKDSGGENFTYDIHSRIQDRIGWRRNRHLPRSANPAKAGSGSAKTDPADSLI